MYNKRVIYRGVEQLAARWAHNPKVVSSSLTPATNFEALSLFFCFLIFILICKIPWRQVSYRKNLLIVFPSSSNLATKTYFFEPKSAPHRGADFVRIIYSVSSTPISVERLLGKSSGILSAHT